MPVGLHSQVEDGVKGFLICSFGLCSSSCTQQWQSGKQVGGRGWLVYRVCMGEQRGEVGRERKGEGRVISSRGAAR